MVVGYDEIAHIVSNWTGVPVSRMTTEESQKLLNLEEILHEKVIGQNQAVEAVSNAVRRARVGLKDPKTSWYFYICWTNRCRKDISS